MKKFVNKFIKTLVFMSALAFIAVLAIPINVSAAPQLPYYFNPPNFQFTSGPNHRYELGRPTTHNSHVPLDVFTANIRRDANVALWPPGYGVFSGMIPTPPSNTLFPQPPNPHFWTYRETHNTNIIPAFDSLQQGVNLQPQGNQMNMFNVGQGTGFLPSTSIVTVTKEE